MQWNIMQQLKRMGGSKYIDNESWLQLQSLKGQVQVGTFNMKITLQNVFWLRNYVHMYA